MKDLNYYLTIIASFILSQTDLISHFLQFCIIVMTAIFSFYKTLSSIKEYKNHHKKTTNE